METNHQSHSWLNQEMYPFKSHLLDLPDGKLHYLDEGKGECILFVHGTPTWSFLFREQIKVLSRNYRCIALDHLGFGLSDKPKGFAGTPEDHSQNLERLVEHLKLEQVTVVVHDFGGPIGLSWAIRNPEKVKRLVLFNTWLWETASNPGVKKISRLLNSWLGRFLYLRMNASPKMLLPKAFFDRSKLSKEVHRHYVKPFPKMDSRYGLLRIGQALLDSSDWYQSQWELLAVLEKKPKLILWGLKDGFIGPEYLARWQKRFPNAEQETFPSGHFPMEEFPEKVTQQLLQFMVDF